MLLRIFFAYRKELLCILLLKPLQMSKQHLKQFQETEFWFELLYETNCMKREEFEIFQKRYIELRRMLVSSVTTLKKQGV